MRKSSERLKRKTIQALLVREQDNALAELRSLLREQGIETCSVNTCAAAEASLGGDLAPRLVFTETNLEDGGWKEIVELAGRVSPSLPVIVISRLQNDSLYLTVLEGGASDFLVPPFREAEVAHVVQSAILSSFGAGSVQHRERETP